MRITCPECQIEYELPDAKIGIKFWCKKCRAVIDTGALSGRKPAPPAPMTPPEPAKPELTEEELLRHEAQESRRLRLLKLRAHTRTLRADSLKPVEPQLAPQEKPASEPKPAPSAKPLQPDGSGLIKLGDASHGAFAAALQRSKPQPAPEPPAAKRAVPAEPVAVPAADDLEDLVFDDEEAAEPVAVEPEAEAELAIALEAEPFAEAQEEEPLALTEEEDAEAEAELEVAVETAAAEEETEDASLVDLDGLSLEELNAEFAKADEAEVQISGAETEEEAADLAEAIEPEPVAEEYGEIPALAEEEEAAATEVEPEPELELPALDLAGEDPAPVEAESEASAAGEFADIYEADAIEAEIVDDDEEIEVDLDEALLADADTNSADTAAARADARPVKAYCRYCHAQYRLPASYEGREDLKCGLCEGEIEVVGADGFIPETPAGVIPALVDAAEECDEEDGAELNLDTLVSSGEAETAEPGAGGGDAQVDDDTGLFAASADGEAPIKELSEIGAEADGEEPAELEVTDEMEVNYDLSAVADAEIEAVDLGEFEEEEK